MSPTPEKCSKNWLEWLVFGISCLLVLGAVGGLVYFGLRMDDGPADLRAEIGEPVAVDGGVRVPVMVFNAGESVATDVRVVVTGRGTGVSRTAEFTVGFVPRGARRDGSVTFAGPDVPDDFRVEATGYEEP